MRGNKSNLCQAESPFPASARLEAVSDSVERQRTRSERAPEELLDVLWAIPLIVGVRHILNIVLVIFRYFSFSLDVAIDLP